MTEKITFFLLAMMYLSNMTRHSGVYLEVSQRNAG